MQWFFIQVVTPFKNAMRLFLRPVKMHNNKTAFIFHLRLDIFRDDVYKLLAVYVYSGFCGNFIDGFLHWDDGCRHYWKKRGYTRLSTQPFLFFRTTLSDPHFFKNIFFVFFVSNDDKIEIKLFHFFSNSMKASFCCKNKFSCLKIFACFCF